MYSTFFALFVIDDPEETSVTKKNHNLHAYVPSLIDGGSSRTDLAIFKVWMKISPPWEVSIWLMIFDPDRLGISNMTLLPDNRKLVKHDDGLLLTSFKNKFYIKIIRHKIINVYFRTNRWRDPCQCCAIVQICWWSLWNIGKLYKKFL